MRLIDADRLLEVYDQIHIGPPGNARIMIETAPTVEMPGWISVQDRLPEERGRYLCWFGKNTFCVGADIATYLPEWHGFGILESDTVLQNITHWMSLPEPPEEVGGDV